MSLEPGLKATVERIVTEADTARALGSGDVDVFGTPAVVAACEEASVLAVKPHLDEGQTTVGTRIELDHLAPTPVGGKVTASAVLDSVDGRSLTFSVSASDGSGEIARGSHNRVVVDRERFLETASATLMVEVSLEEFQRLVADALDEIPEPFASHLSNVDVIVEDEPTAEDLDQADVDADRNALRFVSRHPANRADRQLHVGDAGQDHYLPRADHSRM